MIYLWTCQRDGCDEHGESLVPRKWCSDGCRKTAKYHAVRGTTPPKVKRKPVRSPRVDQSSNLRWASVPGEPLYLAIRRFGPHTEMAERLGLSDRRLNGWKRGEGASFDLADRVLCELELMWFDVWDEREYPLVRAMFEGEFADCDTPALKLFEAAA